MLHDHIYMRNLIKQTHSCPGLEGGGGSGGDGQRCKASITLGVFAVLFMAVLPASRGSDHAR